MKSNVVFDFHPIRNPLLRVNGVCPYFTMFPLNFPYRTLCRRRTATRVLDPFCGRGTTNFAARLLGITAVGIDSNPVGAAVAMAKLTMTTAEQVSAACEAGLQATGECEIPVGEFWDWGYHSGTLSEVCRMRMHLLQKKVWLDAEIFLRALILGILHGPLTKGIPTYLSNQMPRTYATKPAAAVHFWKSQGHRPLYVLLLDAVRRRAAYLLQRLPLRADRRVLLADSRQESTYHGLGGFDLVLTSPPYLGMRTYWPDQWLRNWFLGGSDSVEYAKPIQIQTQDLSVFIRDLSAVWRNVAAVCRSGSERVVRFGALPSFSVDPRQVIRQTIKGAGCGWEIRTIKPAGCFPAGRRQANQFKVRDNPPIDEIDVYCRLAV
ncbi:MAG: DNA modification methylase [Verrucomicrobia bacterium]|nr:DNA modification methylase [Verrucomicrobiota bacterium]